jgi:sterol desaturase/sphingolipid hydroxylase (fatty acid hydroxylase superfamily)
LDLGIDLSHTLVVPIMSATLILMLVLERMRPAREFPVYRGWLWMGLGIMVAFIIIAQLWSSVVPETWLRQHRWLNGADLGVIGGIAIWFPANTFITYWYHRCQHRFNLLWRMVHQLHHGVARVDIPSALVAHPLDVILSTTLSILITALVLGLDPYAVVITGVLQYFMTLVPHWNVHTPKWVGYFVQRPEEHILHHQRGVHAGNYADWPVWDKLFGTYREPMVEPVQVSFDRASFADQLNMLAFVDVNSSEYRGGLQREESPRVSGAST